MWCGTVTGQNAFIAGSAGNIIPGGVSPFPFCLGHKFLSDVKQKNRNRGLLRSGGLAVKQVVFFGV